MFGIGCHTVTKPFSEVNLFQTTKCFHNPEGTVVQNIEGKGENSGTKQFFFTMFSTVSYPIILTRGTFKLSSIMAFNMSKLKSYYCLVND